MRTNSIVFAISLSLVFAGWYTAVGQQQWGNGFQRSGPFNSCTSTVCSTVTGVCDNAQGQDVDFTGWSSPAAYYYTCTATLNYCCPMPVRVASCTETFYDCPPLLGQNGCYCGVEACSTPYFTNSAPLTGPPCN
jgi:hypothetical protein